MIKGKLIKAVLRKPYSALRQSLELCVFFTKYLAFRQNAVAVRASIIQKHGKLVHTNWGDDLNLYLLEKISGKKILFYPLGRIADFINFPCILGIGSIISFWNLNGKIVTGSGVISDSSIEYIRGIPKKVCFVRGPISRKILESKGIETPELCGDLGLTLPLYYKPSFFKKHMVGIVPHFVDENLPSLAEIKKNYPEIKIISVRNYKKWTDVIDSIASCEFIFSSSLHGLIASEAYNIPCQWISFSDKEEKINWKPGWELKFHDFFSSIGKNETEYEMSSKDNVLKLAEKFKKEYVPGKINAGKLIEALPSGLKKPGCETILTGGGTVVEYFLEQPSLCLIQHASLLKECA